ncbi:MAG: glycerol-3-phosphate 1-O-acyltransferase PlsY [Candidatus Cloacimonetes bacterium]|nr:glycerol-3-phosphate 1-O-acyltransferase PlsY [Candidatus Cloacimonadota bacterium]
MWLSISLIMAYLVGSIPFAFIYGKVFKKIDIRQHGSGNVGATNVLRVFGTKAGLIVLFLDIFKGFFPVCIMLMLIPLWSISIVGEGGYEWLPVLVGIFAILGHTFSMFLSFKGGKGVATSAGVFLALCPLNFLGAILFFMLVVFLTKYVSLGSILAIIALMISNFMFFDLNIYVKIFTLIMAIFIIYTHRTNIKRLLNGTENKISFKKKEKQ